MLRIGFADNYTVQVRQTLVHLSVWGLLITLGAFMTNKMFFIPGLLLGWSGSVIYFLLMYRRIIKSAELPLGQAVSTMRSGWLIRLSFIISLLVLSVYVPGIDFFAAVVGLFSLHIILMLNAVFFVVSELTAGVSKSKLTRERSEK